MWNASLRVVAEELPPVIASYLENLQLCYGDLVFARFDVASDDELEQLWSLPGPRPCLTAQGRANQGRGFDGIVQAIVQHPLVKPELIELVGGLDFRDEPSFTLKSSLTLDGELALALVEGGAYEKWRGPTRTAKQLGAEVCEALFGDRFGDVVSLQSGRAWSAWFRGVAWDHSWLIVDRGIRRLTLLCVTDED
jgi:hypothetical protein